MTIDRELDANIDEAKRQACRAYGINDKSLNDNRQHLVGGGLFQHALDIADATIVLVEKGFPGPALALARPLIESWIRGAWASKGDDQEIGDFLDSGRPSPWNLKELEECVKDRIPTETEWLEETIGRREVLCMLNDLTHGGCWQIQYRVGKEAIEPKVPVGMQVALLELGNEIRQKCVTQLREMMSDAENEDVP